MKVFQNAINYHASENPNLREKMQTGTTDGGRLATILQAIKISGSRGPPEGGRPRTIQEGRGGRGWRKMLAKETAGGGRQRRSKRGTG